MSDSKAVLETALKLEPAERIRLLEEISTSLDGLDLGVEWETEIARRVADVDAGRVTTIPGDEAFARVRRRLRVFEKSPSLGLRRAKPTGNPLGGRTLRARPSRP